jgi:hypothetical protein
MKAFTRCTGCWFGTVPEVLEGSVLNQCQQ